MISGPNIRLTAHPGPPACSARGDSRCVCDVGRNCKENFTIALTADRVVPPVLAEEVVEEEEAQLVGAKKKRRVSFPGGVLRDVVACLLSAEWVVTLSIRASVHRATATANDLPHLPTACGSPDVGRSAPLGFPPL